MRDLDPLATQRDLAADLAVELADAGFTNAEEIGRGGFGVVFRCQQKELDRAVAVKVLTSDLGEQNRERFLREQRAMGRLGNHPNIVSILQVGSTKAQRPYLVMQYHPQGSLEKRIRERGPLGLEELLRVGVQLAGALESSHRVGIIHRDVKPGNVLLTDYGTSELSDFGISRISGGFVTMTGSIRGSPAFTAPEVLQGDSPTPSADLYGLGATLFCAATGHAAFERRSGEGLVAQFIRITNTPIPNLREHRIEEGVASIIERAMSANRDDRYRTVAEFGECLREAQLRLGFPIEDMALQIGESSLPEQHFVAQNQSPPEIRGKGNLPLDLTNFVGRQAQITAAQNMLTRSRLVTLTGIGGVGKTRLAYRIADASRSAFTDGVWVAELGELRDAQLLPDIVASALRLRSQVGRPSIDVLRDYLSTKTLLLVLDTCERIVDAVAELAEMLLRACAELRILATSREPLTIGGESVLRVPPLAVPMPTEEDSLEKLSQFDSVALFVERAVATVPTFRLSDANIDTVVKICRQLEGLPLPIELATARLRAMSPENILQRLTDRYSLLTRGERLAPTRQQTLQLCIDWSYDLCSKDEQLLWCELSVFAGTLELDAAEALHQHTEGGSPLIDTVESLVDKSILIRDEVDDRVRFRMLDTLREYGRQKAPEIVDYTELRRRHRDWYQQLAHVSGTEWISSKQLDIVARLEREQVNLREALEFCVQDSPDAGILIATDLFSFWNFRGLFSEGRRWLDRLLETSQAENTGTDHIKALCVDSVLAEAQGDITAGESLVMAAQHLADESSDPLTHAFADHAEGTLAITSGDLDRAQRSLENSLTVFRETGPLMFEVDALLMLGLAIDLRGDPTRAIGFYQEALEITEATGESGYRAFILWAMAIATWQNGEGSAAILLLQQGLQVARLIDPVGTAMCLESLAWVFGEDDPHRAMVLMSAADRIARSKGSTSIMYPALLAYHDTCESICRNLLGSRSASNSRREGASMSFDDAVTYGLSEANHP